jgi:hypothetical protein
MTTPITISLGIIPPGRALQITVVVDDGMSARRAVPIIFHRSPASFTADTCGGAQSFLVEEIDHPADERLFAGAA